MVARNAAIGQNRELRPPTGHVGPAVPPAVCPPPGVPEGRAEMRKVLRFSLWSRSWDLGTAGFPPPALGDICVAECWPLVPVEAAWELRRALGLRGALGWETLLKPPKSFVPALVKLNRVG